MGFLFGRPLVFLGDAPQSTGQLTQAMQTYYAQQALETEEEVIVLQPWADHKPLPKFSGKTIQFYSYRPFETLHPTSTLTEGSTYSTITPQNIRMRNVTDTIKSWGAIEEFTELLSLTAIDANLKQVNGLNAEQAANTIDLDLYYNIAKKCASGYRADGDAPPKEGAVGHGTDLSSTVMCVDLGTDNNEGIGALVNCYKSTATNGGNYGWSGRITDYTGTTDESTCLATVSPAAPNAWTSLDYVRVVKLEALTATDSLTTTNIANAYALILRNHGKPGREGMFKGLISPFTQGDLIQDTTWSSAHSYSDIQALKKHKLKDWFGVTWFYTSQPVRENSIGTWDSLAGTGCFFHNLIVAPHAIGALDLAGSGYKLTVLDGPDKSDPLNERRIIGWKQRHTSVALNGNWIVDLISGATGVAIA